MPDFDHQDLQEDEDWGTLGREDNAVDESAYAASKNIYQIYAENGHFIVDGKKPDGEWNIVFIPHSPVQKIIFGRMLYSAESNDFVAVCINCSQKLLNEVLNTNKGTVCPMCKQPETVTYSRD
uniref:DUF4379 domain-containing protein n=1 Tax=Rhabditophanes sp. KR3021 TaxID=114890 RepID=A0AC35TQT3_9BILA